MTRPKVALLAGVLLTCGAVIGVARAATPVGGLRADILRVREVGERDLRGGNGANGGHHRQKNRSSVPAPATRPLSGPGPVLHAWDGLDHFDQRHAGTGGYAETNRSLEPPDPSICTDGSTVLEQVNAAIRAYTVAGAARSTTPTINEFFGRRPLFTEADGYGDYVTDPKCYYDPDTARWFVTAAEADLTPEGDYAGPTAILIAVSKTSDPAPDSPQDNWYRYAVDATDDGSGGTPSNADCPCFPDQPEIGADRYGFHVTTSEFPLFADGFNGAEVYAFSKRALESGSLGRYVHLAAHRLAEDKAYAIQPATSPQGQYDTSSGGTEYYLSALDFTGTTDNRIAFWKLTNTSSLDSSRPRVSLSSQILKSEDYATPVPADQLDGPRPLGMGAFNGLLGLPPGPLGPKPVLNTNDDRMNQVVYGAGLVWGAVNTAVVHPDRVTRTGVAWFAVDPDSKRGGGERLFDARSGHDDDDRGNGGRPKLRAQGYVSVAGASVFFPAIGVNAAGRALMGFSISGSTMYPSTGYVSLTNPRDSVHVTGVGAAPADGLSGYPPTSGEADNVERWGDYTTSSPGPDGSIWVASQYVPARSSIERPASPLANWGTFVTNVAPLDG